MNERFKLYRAFLIPFGGNAEQAIANRAFWRPAVVDPLGQGAVAPAGHDPPGHVSIAPVLPMRPRIRPESLERLGPGAAELTR